MKACIARAFAVVATMGLSFNALGADVLPQPGAYAYSAGEDGIRYQGTIVIDGNLKVTGSIRTIRPLRGLGDEVQVAGGFDEIKPNGSGTLSLTFSNSRSSRPVHTMLYVLSEGARRIDFVTSKIDGLPPGSGRVITGAAVAQNGTGIPTPGVYAGRLVSDSAALIGVGEMLEDGSMRADRKIFLAGLGVILDDEAVRCEPTRLFPNGTAIFGCEVDGRIDSLFASFGEDEIFLTIFDLGGIAPPFLITGSFILQ